MLQGVCNGNQRRLRESNVDSDVESRWYLYSQNERGTGAEMRAAMVSGIVSRDAPVSCWPKLKGDLHDDFI